MPSPTWVNADQRNVDKLLPWLGNVPGFGDTNPVPALQMAFQLQPPPDAIFFMTDGLLQVNPIPAVAKMNQGKQRVAIHSILVTRPQNLVGKAALRQQAAAQQLRLLAEQNGGTFREVMRK
jgi:hypothetical protein